MFDNVSFSGQISIVRFVAFLKVKKASMKNAAGFHEAALILLFHLNPFKCLIINALHSQ